MLPENAFAVEGSDVVPCVRDHQMLGPNRQPVPMEYDRCSPSIIAFASEAAAERFVREHGGKLTTFRELTPR